MMRKGCGDGKRYGNCSAAVSAIPLSSAPGRLGEIGHSGHPAAGRSTRQRGVEPWRHTGSSCREWEKGITLLRTEVWISK